MIETIVMVWLSVDVVVKAPFTRGEVEDMDTFSQDPQIFDYPSNLYGLETQPFSYTCLKRFDSRS